MKKRAFKSTFSELALIPIGLYKRLLKTIDRLEADEVESINQSHRLDDAESAVGQEDKETTSDGLIGQQETAVQAGPELSNVESQVKPDYAHQEVNTSPHPSPPPPSPPRVPAPPPPSPASPPPPPPIQSDNETENMEEEDLGLKMRVYPCKLCGSAFASKYSLGRHIATLHASKRSVKTAGKKRGRKPTMKGASDMHDPFEDGPVAKQGPVTRSNVQAGKKRSQAYPTGGVQELQDFTENKALNRKAPKVVKTMNHFRRWL